MIDRLSGEVAFEDSLVFSPYVSFLSLKNPKRGINAESLPGLGWQRFFYGILNSDHGPMELEVICDTGFRVHMLLMAHSHSFYQKASPGDSERLAYHEGVLLCDLSGQQEFSWGKAKCHTDPKENKNWLTVIYTPGANVPLPVGKLLRELTASEKIPRDMT